MKVLTFQIVLFFSILMCIYSCMDKDIYKPINYDAYLYSYADETQNATAEITLIADNTISPQLVEAEIPSLKYNKSWLFMLTQDDCVHSAYCRTWAAINGRPVSAYDSTANINYFYDCEQLAAGDLPPVCYYLNNTLGSTDGCGNEVRFHTTTTLSSEWSFMNASAYVRNGYTKSYSRFYMKSGLRWNNVKEMLNYGIGIAFHDVKTDSVENVDSILLHYQIAQDSIVKHLDGRGAKMLAEPNGNKTYVAAANLFPDIQIMTAQTGTVELYPFQTTTDLNKKLLNRYFPGDPSKIVTDIETQMQLSKEKRKAIHVGVHGTDKYWVDFLDWLDNTYGKDGNDSVWFPSLEEYYEYNYYRIHSNIQKTVSGDTIRISVTLPSGKYFYYPAITLNLSNITKEHVLSVTTNDAVTGFSYGNYNNELMLNVDCRKNLLEKATHYVEVYESKQASLALQDAVYFVNQLKDSEMKEALLKRLE